MRVFIHLLDNSITIGIPASSPRESASIEVKEVKILCENRGEVMILKPSKTQIEEVIIDAWRITIYKGRTLARIDGRC